MRLAKPAVAFLLLLYGALPGICAGLCAIKACPVSPPGAAAAAHSCCDSAGGSSEQVRSPDSGMNCCAWIAERADPPATDAKVLASVELPPAILAEPVRVAIAAEPEVSQLLVEHDERGPPGPVRSTAQPRAPPVCRV